MCGICLLRIWSGSLHAIRIDLSFGDPHFGKSAQGPLILSDIAPISDANARAQSRVAASGMPPVACSRPRPSAHLAGFEISKLRILLHGIICRTAPPAASR
jgi:hypothetical protein